MKNISIRKMRLFLAVVEEKSFTRAALKMHISQPAATIIVNQIEEEAGEPLFLRQGGARKAELSPKGRVVAQTFARIVTGVDEELARITDSDNNRRITKRLLIQSSFASAHPGLRRGSGRRRGGPVACRLRPDRGPFPSACRPRRRGAEGDRP
nr:LysR family transcriptional regulator [Paracoccaceae bacterium]